MLRVITSLALLAVTSIWLFGTRGAFGVPGQWFLTPNARPWPLGGWLLPLGVVVIFGGAAALSTYDRFKRAKSDPEKRNSTLTALLCMAILLFLWPWALLGPGSIPQKGANGQPPRLTLEGRFNIIAAQWSDVATEYFGASYQVTDARQFGREYAAKWQKPTTPFQAHIATHPPGAVLWFYGARRIYEALPPLQNGFTALAQSMTGQKLSEMTAGASILRSSASRGLGAGTPADLPDSAIGDALWVSFLLGLSLVIAIPAVYGLASLGTEGDTAEARGLFAVALWILAPTVNLFAFTLDALIASATVWTLFFAAKSLVSSTPKAARGWMLASGVLLALTCFLSIGALAVGLILLLAVVLFCRQQAAPRLVELGGAFLATWIVLALVFAFNPLEVIQSAMAAHHFATLNSRTWAPWTVMNLVMWAPFTGYPLLLAALRREKALSIGAQIGLATFATILLLSLSGNVRGEVERLWLFLLAPAAVWAACSEFTPRVRSALIVVQALQTLALAATLGPLVRP
jgi:hypothetical protein